MKRFTAFAGVALYVALSAFTRRGAADNAKCSEALLPDPHQTNFPLLYQPRHDELTLEVGYVGSFPFPLASAVETTLMYSWAPLDESWHFGARVGLTAGRWGPDARGPVGLGLGLRVAGDISRPMSGVLSVYLFGQADAIALAADGNAVLRPGLGLGLRAARAFGLEASFEPLIPLGGKFSNGEVFAAGFGTSLVVDLCAFLTPCSETAPVPTTVDLTSRLYSAASDIANKADPNQRLALCQAVAMALDASRYPPESEGDPTAAFLSGIAANVADPALKAKLDSLAKTHASLRDELVNPSTGSRVRARLAAQGNHTLADTCVYSPFPVEIRTYLGC